MKIADIYQYKNGKKRVDFFHLGIYELIKHKLNYRFAKIEGKGYYFVKEDETYQLSNFNNIKKSFVKYIKENFYELEINGEIEYHDFMNVYYDKKPLTNGVFAKGHLSEDFKLTEKEIHLFKLETNIKYAYEIKYKKVQEFIDREKFKITKSTFGNFFDTKSNVYFKKISQDYFLILHALEWNNKSKEPLFELYKIKAKDKNTMLKKRNEEIITLLMRFDINSEFSLSTYEKEKTCGNKV